MSHFLRTAVQLVASAVTVAVATTGVVAPSTAATVAPPTAPVGAPTAKTDDTPSKNASAWLAGELDGGLLVGAYGTDYGLSVDAGLAFAQAGDTRSVSTVSKALAAQVNNYISGGAADPNSTYAGPTAKTAVFAQTAGANPTNYGGINLITRLEAQTLDSGPAAGRITDTSKYGDYANVVGQSFAVRALGQAKSAEATAATSFLLAQQCTSGYFRLSFDKVDAASQACVDGASGSEADTDATSLAVINLIESGVRGTSVNDALAKAGTWLAAQQKSNGSFGGGTSTAKPNVNSTGLAGQALAALKNREAAAKAAVWVRANQPYDANRCKSALTKEQGAVGYDAKAVKAARTAGITDATRDQWRRATAQAIGALVQAPAAVDKLAIMGQRGAARSGDKVKFSVVGLAPGQRACVSIKGDAKRIVGKAFHGAVSTRLTMPTGNLIRTVLVKTAAGSAKTKMAVTN